MPKEFDRLKEDLKNVPTWVWYVGAGAAAILFIVRARSGASSTATTAPDSTAATPAGTVTPTSTLSASDLQSLLGLIQQQQNPATNIPPTAPAVAPLFDPSVFNPAAWAAANPGLPVPGPTVNGVTPGNAPFQATGGQPPTAQSGFNPAIFNPAAWASANPGLPVPNPGAAPSAIVDSAAAHGVTAPTSRANPYG